MLDFAMDYNGPLAIRYPRGEAYRGLKEFRQPIAYGKGEMLYEEEDIALLAVGSMVSTGEHVRQKLKAEGYSCSLANGRFVKPFDTENGITSGEESPPDCHDGGKCAPGRLRPGGHCVYP